jgi:hypothetical protein
MDNLFLCCFVLCSLDDEYLTEWVKLPEPVVRYPPANQPFSCWRDPFCLQRGDPATGKEWIFLLCSGIEKKGGAVLVYKSKELVGGKGVWGA